jgi:membrane fusion protein, multidrug efflux system
MTTVASPPRDIPAGAKPVPPTRRRNPIPLLILGAVVLSLAGWGIQRYRFGQTHVSSDDAQVDGHITPIAPKVQAFVERVLVEDNQRVRAGDTLVVLDARPFRARLDQAEAEYRAALAAAGNGGRTGAAAAQLAAARSSAAGASAGIASAEATLRKATADLARYAGLAASKVISAQQLDQAQWAHDNATAALDVARKQAAAATSQVTAAESQLAAASARVASADAARKDARLVLDDAVLLAATDGVVAKRSAEAGALVQPGQQLLAIVPETRVWVTANLKETQLEKLRPGDRVEIEVDAYPGAKFRGAVESLSPVTGARFALLPPDNATGNFTKVVQRVPVRIAVDPGQDPAHPLRPGMSAVVTIATR